MIVRIIILELLGESAVVSRGFPGLSIEGRVVASVNVGVVVLYLLGVAAVIARSLMRSHLSIVGSLHVGGGRDVVLNLFRGVAVIARSFMKHGIVVLDLLREIIILRRGEASLAVEGRVFVSVNVGVLVLNLLGVLAIISRGFSELAEEMVGISVVKGLDLEGFFVVGVFIVEAQLQVLLLFGLGVLLKENNAGYWPVLLLSIMEVVTLHSNVLSKVFIAVHARSK